MEYLELLQTKAFVIGGTLIVGFLLGLAKRKLPSAIHDALNKTIFSALDPDKIKDPVLLELVRDLMRAYVRLTEYLIPDGGMGALKKQVVVDALSKILPAWGARGLADMADLACASADKELKEIQKSAILARRESA